MAVKACQLPMIGERWLPNRTILASTSLQRLIQYSRQKSGRSKTRSLVRLTACRRIEGGHRNDVSDEADDHRANNVPVALLFLISRQTGSSTNNSTSYLVRVEAIQNHCKYTKHIRWL